MFKHTWKLMLSSGVALAATCGSVVAALQETPVWIPDALGPYWHANEPMAPMRNSNATPNGAVADDARALDNLPMLEIVCVAPVPPSARTKGEVEEDARITTTVTARLMWSKHTNNLSTHVHTNRGKVTLRGIAGSAAASNHASRLVMDTRGVWWVDNQLLVMGTKSAVVETTPSPVHAAKQDIADRWITMKVRSTFMSSNSVDGASIAVNTRSGIVTLSGTVDSGTERALAIELANSVRGVESVQSEWFTPFIGQSLLKTAAHPD